MASDYRVLLPKIDLASVPHVPLLSAYLDAEALAAFLKSMAEVHLQEGALVMQQGDKGSQLYIVKEGELEVCISEGGTAPQYVRTLGPGDGCGELCCTAGGLRSATVRVVSDGAVLLTAPKKSMVACGLSARLLQKRKDVVPFLSTVHLLAEYVSDYGRSLLADAARELRLEAGERVTSAGSVASGHFYIVRSGSIANETEPAELGAGDYFGQVARRAVLVCSGPWQIPPTVHTALPSPPHPTPRPSRPERAYTGAHSRGVHLDRSERRHPPRSRRCLFQAL